MRTSSSPLIKFSQSSSDLRSDALTIFHCAIVGGVSYIQRTINDANNEMIACQENNIIMMTFIERAHITAFRHSPPAYLQLPWSIDS